MEYLESLQIALFDVQAIEERTRTQTACPEWFQLRKGRVTASLNNKIFSIKTSRGFTSLAAKLVQGDTPNEFSQRKMDFGKFHEPIAIEHYEKFMAANNHHVQVEPSGLILDHVNYIFGATPDGKITDPSEDFPFGILEVKCSEEYKNNDPADIVYLSKNPCIVHDDGVFKLSSDHSYFAQIQMQLALSTQSWCDFVLYTNKGLVIDRVRYDPNYWEIIRGKLLEFYFKFLLPELVKEQ